MLNEQIENIERTAYEGLLDPLQSVAIGCVLAFAAGWLLLRERRTLGSQWTMLFWGLRVAAIGLVLWMLAGPTHLTIRRVTSPQAIALLIDDTGSMNITDPPVPTDDLRWRLATGGDELNASQRVVTLCDRACVQLAEAVSAAAALDDAVAEHRPPRHLQPIVERARRAADEAGRLLNRAADEAGRENDLLAERIDRLIRLFKQTAMAVIDQIGDELSTDDSTSVAAIDSACATLTEAFASAQRRGVSLAEDATRLAAEFDSGTASPATARHERVESLLKKLDQEVLTHIEKTCIVHRLRFSEMTSGLRTGPNARTADGGPRLTRVSTNMAGLDNDDQQSNITTTPTTDISAALRTVESLRSSGPLRMAWLLTDGRHNAGGGVSPQEVAARLAAMPVHVTPIGSPIPVRDILIHRVEAPSRVVRKDTATVEVLLTALDCAGENVEVVLTRDGQEIDRKPFSITRNWQDGRVAFRIDTAEPDASESGTSSFGTREYEIEVEAVPDEASLVNNLGVATIEVVRDELRVLLADSRPRWEYRYLQQLFRRDKHVKFDELLMQPKARATGRRQASGRLPSDVDGWVEYDVVILGDLGPDVLGDAEQQSLREYVQDRGGSVILIAGRQNLPHRYLGGPLIDLLPVRSAGHVTPRDGFGVALTDDARLASCVALRETFRESSKIWHRTYARMPIYGLSDYCQPKPNARVLIEAQPINDAGRQAGEPSLAFFSWHPVGTGKVAYLGAAQTYRLRFRRGDRDHHAFWGQTLRWITAEQNAGRNAVRIETDRTQYTPGQSIEVTVWLRDPQGKPVTDAEVEVEARALDEVAARVELRPEGDAPGRYVGTVDSLPVGAFEMVPIGDVIDAALATAKNEVPRKRISIESSGDIEMLNTQANHPLLEQIAERTGGQITPPTAVAELLGVASLDPEVTDSPPVRTPLWNRWSFLMIVGGCLMIEWIIRKAKGLT